MLTYVKKGVVMSSRRNKFLNILKRQKKVEFKIDCIQANIYQQGKNNI